MRYQLKKLFCANSTWWFFGAVCFLFTGATYLYNFTYGYDSLTYTVMSCGYGLLLLLPLLTLPLSETARERRWEHSLPDSLFVRTLDVFGAGIVGILTATLPLLLLVFLIGNADTVNQNDLWVAYLGCFLYMTNLFSVNLFLASFGEKKWQKWLYGVGANIFLFALSLVVSYLPSELSLALQDFLPLPALTTLLSARLSLSSVLSLGLWSVVFFLLTMAREQYLSRRNLSFRLSDWVKPIVALLLVVATVGGLLFLPKYKTDINVSKNDFSELTDNLKERLDNLEGNYTLLYFAEDGEKGKSRTYSDFFEAVADYSDNIQLIYADTEKELGSADALEENSVVVYGKGGYVLLNGDEYTYYYNYYLNMRMTYTEYYTYIYAYYYGDSSTESYQIGQNLAQYDSYTYEIFDGEGLLIDALVAVSREEMPKCAVYNSDDVSDWFYRAMVRAGYDIYTITDLQNIEDDTEWVVMWNVDGDISLKEANNLSAYLKNGGKLFLNTFYEIGTNHTNLSSVLTTYGMDFTEKTTVILEGDEDYYYSTTTTDSSGSSSTTDYPYYVYSHTAPLSALGGKSSQFMGRLCHGIVLTETAGVSLSKWLYTSTSAYTYIMSETDGEWGPSGSTKDTPGEQIFGALSQKDGEGTILWVSAMNPDSTANSLSDSNTTLILTAMATLSGNTYETTLSPIVMATYSFTPTDGETTLYVILCVVLLPCCIVGGGLATLKLRRKRR